MKQTNPTPHRHNEKNTLRQLFLLSSCLSVVLFFVASCANPGSGPDGGPYDETPPRILSTTPVLGQSNASPKKVTLYFDENVKLENAAEKIIVSPPQQEMPVIKALGKKITVSLLDTLKDNTTYTIDFSDAIEDNNEGNPMGQFTYFFSTGNQLDTMEVAGTVITADDLEPVKGILVGLHSDTTDTAFTSKPFDRVARTNGDGRFSIKGVAPGAYRIYALKDMDGDFKMSRGEMLAFSEELIIPTSFEDLRYDTLWTDTLHYDTIISRRYTHFLPDDIVLKAFTEVRTDRMLLKTQRDVPEWFRVYFTAPSEHVPIVKGLNFDEQDAFLEERSKGNDTITYWLKDFKHFPSVDTLSFSYTYEAFDDSTQVNVLRTDTFQLVPRFTLERRLKNEAKDLEKWEKRREKRHKRGDFSDETPPQKHLSFEYFKGGKFSPVGNVHFKISEPLARLDTAGIHLLHKKDTIFEEAPFLLERDPYNLTTYTLKGEWRPGQRYEVVVDSAALTGLSGLINLKENEVVNIPKMEEYGALFLILPDADTSAVVQLVSGKKVRQMVPVKNGRADLYYLNPGKYYLRMFNDHNQNGRWDTGKYEDGLQAEEVFYFPSVIEVRANWDIEQTWRVNELPLTLQKPRELIKQKESKKKSPHSKNLERERQRGRH